ncbi:hypothetical protein [Cupriavidus pauculus]|uniref:Uncharacterized protein n=1 Tax=Cupriavidus pauculus TaxID=82633 RepID=A0A2N5CC93_9BURK|nr:hypothetical protein [Cupriavidus pauculus]PLP99791.1 hypothetical protein CYJ10_15525 [Cupriavidus pauculus]
MSSVIHYLRGGAAAIAAVVACAAHASDIACEAPATRASQIICETALFSMGYQRIYADQQRLLKAGVISQADIDAFRRQRDACDSANCLDTVFSAWRQHLTDIGAPRSRQGR